MYLQSAFIYELFDSDVHEAMAQEDFFLSYAKDCARALDVGAGTGTVAFGLAKQNIPVVCLEPSATMRGLLVSRLAYNPELQRHVTPLPYNAVNFQLVENFPLIYATNVLHLVVRENERTAIMSNIVNHLEAGGKAIVDFRIGGLSVKEKELSGEVNLGGICYRRYTTIRQEGDSEWLYRWFFEVYDSERQIESFQEEFHVKTDAPETCRDFFRQNGLNIQAEYSDYQKTQFNENEPCNRLIIVGRLD